MCNLPPTQSLTAIEQVMYQSSFALQNKNVIQMILSNQFQKNIRGGQTTIKQRKWLCCNIGCRKDLHILGMFAFMGLSEPVYLSIFMCKLYWNIWAAVTEKHPCYFASIWQLFLMHSDKDFPESIVKCYSAIWVERLLLDSVTDRCCGTVPCRENAEPVRTGQLGQVHPTAVSSCIGSAC